MGMCFIKENTSSSFVTNDAIANNSSNNDMNMCMCFVTLSFSHIFNVWNLFLKHILVIAYLYSYNMMSFSQATWVNVLNCTWDTKVSSKNLLIVDNERLYFYCQWVIPPIFAIGSIGIPLIIYVIVGVIDFTLILSIIVRVISLLRIITLIYASTHGSMSHQT
jgi:hypothetical protein